MQRNALLDPGVGRDERRLRLAGEGVRLISPVHDVAMDFQVLGRRADVDPVAVVHVGDEGLAALDQRREVAPLDRPGGVLGDAVEGLRLEHVNAGVDRIARDFVLTRLLEETAHVLVLVGFDQPVGARVVHRRQHDRCLRLALAMEPEHRTKIDLRQHVAVEDHHRLGQGIPGIADRAARPQRHRLDDVAELDAEAIAVAENLLDAPRLVIQAQDHLVDLRNLTQEVDLVIEKGPVEDRHDRLRRVDGQRSQAGALTAGKQDGLHSNPR